MTTYNGYLVASPIRHAPQTDLDLSPINLRRYVNASGFQDVQQFNGLQRRNASGLILPIDEMRYDYLASTVSPGVQRDNFGGFHKHGVGISQYQQTEQASRSAQPQSAGGPRQMLGDQLYNPGTS